MARFLLSGQRQLLSSTTRWRWHLRQTVQKHSPRNDSPCSRSLATCLNGMLPIRPTDSLPSSTGNRWQSPIRFLSSEAASSDESSQSSPPKQIQVWEQTISSSNANTSSNAKDGAGEETQRVKGRIRYRPMSNHDKKKSIVGWEVVTSSKSATPRDASAAPLSAISSAINTYKMKDLSNIQNLPFIHHFLPAQYPNSVCPSYATYATYCFLGSIAGSSAMVLSTQALLVAVGVGTQSAAPMAAALNWVMKDGVGQLGGVIFASQLGKGGIDFDHWRGKFGKLTGSVVSKSSQKQGNFQRGTADSNPKRWRMVAALALDLSTLLEICTPMMGPGWFLPCASIANIGKNVGFLAASASRAAIHQSLSQGGSPTVPVDEADPSKATEKAKTGTKSVSTTGAKSSNLGDVTAKSGSQSIVASLLGTAIGIFFSQTFCSEYGTAGILAGFVVLSAVHQVCTYQAVKVVPLRSLDRHRLHIVLSSYNNETSRKITESNGHDREKLETDIHASMNRNIQPDCNALSPVQVAEKESFLPMVPPDDSVRWLSVGASLMNICPSGIAELEQLLLPKQSSHHESLDQLNKFDEFSSFDSKQYEKYVLKVHPPKGTDENASGMVQLTYLEGATDEDLLRGMFHAYAAHAFMKSNDDTISYLRGDETSMRRHVLQETHNITSTQIPMFIEHLREVGWQIGTGFVNIECGSSYRLKIHSA